MAIKNSVVISLLFAFFIAQAPVMQAQIIPINPLINQVVVVITNLTRTITGAPIVNVTSPVFSGALVRVTTGGNLLGLGITDLTGSVNITVGTPLSLPALSTLLNNLLNNGIVTILTPVATPNATLPTGILRSRLQLIESFTQGLINFIRFGPVRFNVTAVV